MGHKREEDKLQKAAVEKNMTKAKESKKTDLEGQRKQLDKDKTRLEENQKKLEEDAAESLQQIMAVKQQLQKVEQVKSQPKPKLPTKVMVVNSNSFVPQKNTKHEIGVIKMGSPSQIRRAVKMEVKIEESETSSKSELGREPVGNYQITKVPTTSFELKKPQTLSEGEKEYPITKVPTSTVVLEQMTKMYVENVAKYSETKPAENRKRSTSTPRPPPPSFKPPPPPPLFKPPPPPPL